MTKQPAKPRNSILLDDRGRTKIIRGIAGIGRVDVGELKAELAAQRWVHSVIQRGDDLVLNTQTVSRSTAWNGVQTVLTKFGVDLGGSAG